jgi:hypothetical protein
LSELATSTGGTLEVRLTSHPIPLGVVAVDAAAGRHTDYSALFIEYYTFQAAGEPKFVLQPVDTWFPQFLAEAELLWSGARQVHLPQPE